MTHNTHAHKALTVRVLKNSWEPLWFPGYSLASPWTFFYTQWIQSIILCHSEVVQYKTSFVIWNEYHFVLTLLLMVPYFDFIFPGAHWLDFWLGLAEVEHPGTEWAEMGTLTYPEAGLHTEQWAVWRLKGMAWARCLPASGSYPGNCIPLERQRYNLHKQD